MSPKKMVFTLIALFITGIIIIPIVVAKTTSTTSVVTPFITIDPIGNHTVDEVFYITGTTNLAVANDSLYLQIESVNANPGGIGSFFWSNVSIHPGKNEINIWSINSTASQWETYAMRSPPTSQGAMPGEYTVMIVSPNPNITAESTQQFFLVSSGNEPTSPQVSTTNTISENDSQKIKTTENDTGQVTVSPTKKTPLPGIITGLAIIIMIGVMALINFGKKVNR